MHTCFSFLIWQYIPVRKQARAHTLSNVIVTDALHSAKYINGHKHRTLKGIRRIEIPLKRVLIPLHVIVGLQKLYPMRTERLSVLQVNKKICKITISRKKELKGH